MKTKRYLLWSLAALLLFASCKEETMTLNITATLEQPAPEEEEGKNYLHNEEWIHWEEGDAIMISVKTDACSLTNGAGTRTAFFANQEVEITAGTTIKAIYPASAYVPDKGFTHLSFPKTMTYRSADVHGVAPDETFSKESFPMVAQFTPTSGSTSAQMDFHSVSGLVRVHIYSTLSTKAKVESIKFTSVDKGGNYTTKQISGVFTVNDINTNTPYLTATHTGTAITAEEKSITITGINQTIGGGTGNFLTFYLPLPATKSGTVGGAEENNRTFYALEMEVTAKEINADDTEGGALSFKKTMGVRVQRNTMMKMQALDIQKWSDATDNAFTGLVGDGSEMRPYQIYTYADLDLVRRAFKDAAENNTAPVINGKVVEATTCFAISRSDITLWGAGNPGGHPVWSEGIIGFIGRMKGSSSNPTNFGITNNSQAPLFESISSMGSVEYITVKSDATIAYTSDDPFSPFCITNYGMMDNCQSYVNIDATNNVAGLCVENRNTITSSANMGTIFSSNGRAAGLCLDNYGMLQGFSYASARIFGKESVAICFHNHAGGVLKDCVVAVNFGNFGVSGSEVRAAGLVFTNDGLAQNCLVNGTVLSGLGECHIGAVSYTNRGIIDNCLSNVVVANVTTMAGIAAYQIGEEALISNCGVQSGSRIIATSVAAGIVGYLEGGAIKNSYSRAEASVTDDAAEVGGIVAVLGTASNTPGTIVMNNVYSSHGVFFGATANKDATNDVHSGTVTVNIDNCYSLSEKTLINGVNADGTDNTIVIESFSSLTETGTLGEVAYTSPLAYRLNKTVYDSELGSAGGGSVSITWNTWTDEATPMLNHPTVSYAPKPTHRRSNADRIATRTGGRR